MNFFLYFSRYKSKDEEDQFQYTVGICTKVAQGLENPDKPDVKFENVAVLQQDLKEGQPEAGKVHDIGNLQDTHIMTGSEFSDGCFCVCLCDFVF